MSPSRGAERLMLVIMNALYLEGINFDLTTCVRPNVENLVNSYGDQIPSTIIRAEKVNILESLEEAGVSKS
ncbi:MAG: hypothetical protein M3258_02010 [Thermoproteota archaeon]|nr:hypothetical protein [Thermoproteota archaeon]